MLGWIIKNAMPPKIIRINGRSLTRIRASFTRPAAFTPIIFMAVRENKKTSSSQKFAAESLKDEVLQIFYECYGKNWQSK